MVDVKLFGPPFAAGELPAIQVAGVLVTVYVKDGQLVISADFDESELGVVTPVVVRMSGETVWSVSVCERCHAEPIADEDSGLCASCVANNDSRVIL